MKEKSSAKPNLPKEFIQAHNHDHMQNIDYLICYVVRHNLEMLQILLHLFLQHALP
eukprot:c42324_g1_i1 orf=96-263(+)